MFGDFSKDDFKDEESKDSPHRNDTGMSDLQKALTWGNKAVPSGG